MSHENTSPEPEPVAEEQTGGGRRPSACSRSLVSESKVEEIIACLWSLMWVILWVNHAPQWMLWAVGIKAASDHLCAVVFAIREIRRENTLALTPARETPDAPGL